MSEKQCSQEELERRWRLMLGSEADNLPPPTSKTLSWTCASPSTWRKACSCTACPCWASIGAAPAS